MAEPRSPDDVREEKQKREPWDDFFDGPRCPDFPDREQPRPEEREPL